MVVKNDISIIFCTDLSVKESIKDTIGNWSRKGVLKKFIFIDNFESNKYTASECINGTYVELKDLKTTLSNIELDLIRTVAVTSPNTEPLDIQNFIDYLNLPSNIKFTFLNTIVPTTLWHKSKELNAGSHLANANILISPVDRPNPTRVPVDINNLNYANFASVNLISIASLWRGMEESPFDHEQKNRQGEVDFIVTRNFVRVLLGPDPVDGLIDSITTDEGRWITPNKNYDYPSNDVYLLADFANKIINNYYDSFHFQEISEKDLKEAISFPEYFKRRYADISFDQPLPLLTDKKDTFEQLNDYLTENNDFQIVSDEDVLNEVSELSTTLVSSLATRGQTNLPKLWRDIRSIVFSLLDGSSVPSKYSEFKQNIIINNSNSIISKTESIQEEVVPVNDEEDSLELLSSDISSLQDVPSYGSSFFDNFKNKLREQSILALSSLRNSIQEILEFTYPDDENKILYKKYQKRAKFLDRLLAIYLFNLIIYIVNQILVTGGYVDIILSVPLLDSITPRRIIYFSIFLVGYWLYVLFKLFGIYKKFNKDSDGNLIQLTNAAKQVVELHSLLEQFKLWEKIYRLLIHESLNKNNLNIDLDDSYVDFSPLLSIKGAIGSIQKEVIEEIQLSIIKEGWFLDVYEQIEEDFRKFTMNKILRIEDNILDQIDSEATGIEDTDSARYLFYKFLDDGHGNESLKTYMQSSVENTIDNTESSELFSEVLNSGKSLSEFLREINKSDSPSELQFDKNIWSNVAKVFEVQEAYFNKDDAGATLFDVQHGSPIQRVIVRTDTSDNVEKRLIANISVNFNLCSDCLEDPCVCQQGEVDSEKY